MKYEGRTFVVSGGASGLGRACVVDICRGGGHAFVLDMNEALGAALVEELGGGGPGGPARFRVCDVTDTASIAGAVAAAAQWAKESGRPLGGVIAAAGVGRAGLILDRHCEPLALSDFDFVVSVNLRGTFDLVRQLLPLLASAPPLTTTTTTTTTTTITSSSSSTLPPPDGERGVVVMVASAAALEGQKGQVAYAASKGGVASMTLPMARDLSRFGIRVVTVAPGPFETAMTSDMSGKVKRSLQEAMVFPARPGRPDELAALVRHVVENGMLNAAVVRIDGGVRLPSKM